MPPVKAVEHGAGRKWLAYGALAAGVICIAWSAIFVKLAAVTGAASAFYRVLFAAVVLIPWRLQTHRPSPTRSAVMLAVIGGILFALDLVLWNTALLFTSAANATLLANNAPLWVGLGALLIFRERLHLYFWVGLALSLLGMGLVVSSGTFGIRATGYGDGLAICASVFYAAYLLTAQRVRDQLDTLTFMTLSAGVSAIFLFTLCLTTGVPLLGYGWRSWAALLGLGLVSQLGGWLAINYALGHIRAAIASVTLLGQVVLTALFSVPVLGEFLTFGQISGAALVLVGILLAHHKGGCAPAERGRVTPV